MPVKEAKKELIEGTLRALTIGYQMPDDRVYIDEIPSENVGHTPLLGVTHGEDWAVQSEPARIIIEVIAPPGIPIEAKRTLVRELTMSPVAPMGAPICATCWSRSISTRSRISPATASFKPRTPDMAPFAAMLQRG